MNRVMNKGMNIVNNNFGNNNMVAMNNNATPPEDTPPRSRLFIICLRVILQ